MKLAVFAATIATASAFSVGKMDLAKVCVVSLVMILDSIVVCFSQRSMIIIYLCCTIVGCRHRSRSCHHRRCSRLCWRCRRWRDRFQRQLCRLSRWRTERYHARQDPREGGS
jgi:hypothetical protein